MTLLAAACSGGEAEPVERVALADAPPAPTEAPATTSSSSSTTIITTTTNPTVDDREAEILAVIDLYWHAVVEANNPPDPDHELWPQLWSMDQGDFRDLVSRLQQNISSKG